MNQPEFLVSAYCFLNLPIFEVVVWEVCKITVLERKTLRSTEFIFRKILHTYLLKFYLISRLLVVTNTILFPHEFAALSYPNLSKTWVRFHICAVVKSRWWVSPCLEVVRPAKFVRMTSPHHACLQPPWKPCHFSLYRHEKVHYSSTSKL